MKTKLTLSIIFQLVGVTSSFFVSEVFDPNFGFRHSEALRNEYLGLASQYFANHLTLMLLGYAPFGLLSAVLLFPLLLKHYPFPLSSKQKQGLAIITLFLSIPLISSVPGYFVAMSGGAIPRQEALIFAVTPIALALIMSGTLGVFMLATLPEHLNSKTGAWLRFIIGFALIFIAWNFLEFLLRITYIK